MIQLNPDVHFHYETMRALGTIPYHGADLSEVLETIDKITPGDFNSWYNEWYALAQRVLSTVTSSSNKPKPYSAATLRAAYFRASHYFFVADFFLHGNKTDPRITDCYELWRTYFDKANALLDIPGTHYTVDTPHGFSMPAIMFRASVATSETPRPTLIVGGGFESCMQETFHVFGVAALERGYNVLIYEGPGHRTLVNQGHGFIAEWEKAVTPLVDFVLAKQKEGEFAFVDTAKLGLVGMSMGGYLAARAAAFEDRLAAVICIDGVWGMLEPGLKIVPQVREAWERGDKAEFDRIFEADPGSWSTNRRWFHDDLKYTFRQDSGFEAYKITERMTLGGGVAQKIRMPAYVGSAADDLWFVGQPERVASAIGENATLKTFTADMGAQLHCQSGALVYMNQDMLEWFAGVVGH